MFNYIFKKCLLSRMAYLQNGFIAKGCGLIALTKQDMSGNFKS